MIALDPADLALICTGCVAAGVLLHLWVSVWLDGLTRLPRAPGGDA